MVDPVGTPLAALATAEQCVKLVAKLRKEYINYLTAEHSLRELSLVLEHRSVTIESQVIFLRSVWSSLDGRLQNLQNTLLHILYHKLQYAIELVDAAIGTKQERPSIQTVLAKHGPIRKFYFAFSLKQCLQKTVDDLEKWHKMFDPTWYLICRTSGSMIDTSLQQQTETKSVAVLRNLRSAVNLHKPGNDQSPSRELLDPEVLTNATPGSDLDFGIYCTRLHSGEVVIVNRFTPHKQASVSRTRDEVDRLVSTLANVDPQVFGLLQCHGTVQYESSTILEKRPSYDLLFLTPPGLIRPTTLRARLDRTSSVSMNIRLSLAQSLSNAVMFVHSSQFVHKNIRPETILTFETASSQKPTPYLLGFEKFRLATGETFKAGDASWESNLYRHPKRQGLWPEEEYIMLHDVYSLGVVLLEVGLWTSFVTYKRSNTSFESGSGTENEKNPGTEPSIADEGSIPELGPMLSSLSAHIAVPTTERARLIQSRLIDLARNQLPCTMGEKYAQIVVRCLTCLDAVNPGLGDPDEFLDEDDVVVGVEFVESVIMGLHEISC